MRASTPAIAVAVVTLLHPAITFAHAHLKAAEPADKAVLSTAPASIKLEFNEGIELKFSGVTLTGPGKAQIKTGDAVYASGKASVMEVPVPGPLSPGDYAVEWHVLSKDGHKIKGSTTFTFKP